MNMRTCVKCLLEKDIEKFRKRKKWYSHTCKSCYASQYRTGIPNSGRYQKGNKPTHGFPKGHVPWIKGRKLSAEHIEKVSAKLKGRSLSPEHIAKIQAARKASTKVFRDGTSRRSRKSVEWALLVKLRDGNKCMHCLSTEYLHAHHIMPWRLDESLRYEISNGISLCRSCHKKEERRMYPVTTRPKGTKLSEDHKRKLSMAAKGRIPWNKGKINKEQ